MNKILYVNACTGEDSRTNELAQHFLGSLDGHTECVNLYEEKIKPLDAELLFKRDKLLKSGKTDDDFFRLARQFASADTIVIAAPYWDLAFPAKVRAYLEEITVSGITFQYGPDGVPRGLCKAEKLIYVTTAGGPVFQNFGFEYVQSLARNFYGIADVRLVKAEGLDIWGADPVEILERAKQEIPAILNEAE